MEKFLTSLRLRRLILNAPKLKILAIAMILIMVFGLFPKATFAQDKTYDLVIKNLNLESALKKVIEETSYQILYKTADVTPVKNLDLNFKNATIQEIIEKCLEKTDLTYTLKNRVIVIKKKEARDVEKKSVEISGRVLDEAGFPLPGATILEEGTTIGMTSDANGLFKFKVSDITSSIKVSYVGFQPQVIPVAGKDFIDIVLKEASTDLDEVVVTGIFVRKESSYTGSTTKIKAEELKKVGSVNVFQALKNIDPTMVIAEDFEMGSDPSKMPDIQIRGTSTLGANVTSDVNSQLKGNYLKNPNQPLFIVDGFEASIEHVYDMDMDRIESITILKDASAKAIYGSKAANGVVVIETKKLLSTETRVTFNSSINLEIPDLTSYNLANASEKLQAELIDGMYTPSLNDASDLIELQQLYNSRKKLIAEGLDTDWISKPIRTGVGNKQTLSVELGGENLKVLADIAYNNVNGVMKGSSRENIMGSLNISYRVKNLLFRNIMSVNSNRSEESPYGSFSEYAKMNPYWKAENLDGSIPYFAEIGPNGEAYTNPLYNSTINTELTSSYFNFTNNFYLEWTILQGLKATTRIGIDVKNSGADAFYPSTHTYFVNTPKERKGLYTINDGKSTILAGDLNINYSKEINKHFYFANAGFNISEGKYEEIVHSVEGFPSDQMNNIIFGRQYVLNSTPVGIDGISRNLGFLGVFSYMYDNRFLTDASIRTSASSLFGADRRWATHWSFGIGWNLHNEKFMEGLGFEQLKIRGSLGSTGNGNFNTNASIATYSYYLDKFYQGNIGSYLQNMANRALQWESKFDYNAGFDMKYKKIGLKFDYYQTFTENLITDITIPNSTGFSMVKENVGKVKNSGFEIAASYLLWSKQDNFLNVTFSIAHNKNEIIELSDAMRSFNEAQDKLASSRQTNRPVHKYEDGISMNAIWAVPSLGIDPTTGQEIYVDRDGNTTFEWDASNMVVCGNSAPDYRGNFSINGEVKGIGFNVTCRFFWGGQYYNQTLVDKVENVDMNYNVDKRVLTGRWLYPGQITSFKRLGQISEDLDGDGTLETHYIEKTRLTSRFVQDYNEFSISAINLYYDFNKQFLDRLNIGIERLKVSFNMNEVARISTIKAERGISYPFARTLTFSLSATF